jgi:phage terminase small subunit
VGGPNRKDYAGLARWEKFCHEYVVDMNGKQAAIRAGFSERSAAVTASQLLTKPNVKALVNKLTEKIVDKYEVNAERVIRELALLGFSNMQDYITITDKGDAFVDLSSLTRDQAAAIQEVIVDSYMEGRGADAREVKRTRFKLVDKKSSLETLARHLGLLREKVEVTGKDGGPIQYADVREEIMRRLDGMSERMKATDDVAADRTIN